MHINNKALEIISLLMCVVSIFTCNTLDASATYATAILSLSVFVTYMTRNSAKGPRDALC